jgi:6-phosphogluconolactonase
VAQPLTPEPPTPAHGQVQVVEDVAAAFAELVSSEMTGFAARAAGDTSARFRFAMSGGPTARLAYERLASVPGLPWEQVEVFWGDERCVPFDDPDSNALLGHEALLDQVGPTAAEHRLSCEDGAEAYEQLLHQAGPLDLVHLGLGPDGHTASLFAGSEALESPGDRLVMLSHDPAARNPHARITLTLAAINAARLVVFTVSGEAKRDAFARVCSAEAVPAGQVAAERVVWLVDAAAAGGEQRCQQPARRGYGLQ